LALGRVDGRPGGGGEGGAGVADAAVGFVDELGVAGQKVAPLVVGDALGVRAAAAIALA
jgi:hypothetical protein